ncbi:DUF2244 domain-containing protein [Aquabacterium sp. UBA2148]|uniref:DUF2244 domain-containing protein n=1 Tax=Aquabacterium sp. UBA2148 TaxID=1946042 RepID=UPI0032E525B6
MTATASPVRMLPNAPMRFGVWRALPVSRRSRQASVSEAWQAEWRLPRVMPISTSRFVFCSLALLVLWSLTLVLAGGSWRAWGPGLAGGCLLTLAGAALLARMSSDGEHIAMHRGLVRVTRRQGGRVRTTDFLPRWVRIEPEQHDRSLVRLSGQGRSVTVGEHIQPQERRQLADELRWALRQLDD